jgi:hypothetical protein
MQKLQKGEDGVKIDLKTLKDVDSVNLNAKKLA